MTDTEFLEHLLATLPAGAKHVKMLPADYARLYKLSSIPQYGAVSGKSRTRSAPRIRHLVEKAQANLIRSVVLKLEPQPSQFQWAPHLLAKIRATKAPPLTFNKVPITP